MQRSLNERDLSNRFRAEKGALCAGHLRRRRYALRLDDDGTLYVSGQLSVDPRTGAIPEGLAAQTAQALSNVAAVLAAAGADKGDVRMCRVYTPDVANWDVIDEQYALFFGAHKPARVVVPTTALHFGCLVEIEAVAKIKEKK